MTLVSIGQGILSFESVYNRYENAATEFGGKHLEAKSAITSSRSSRASGDTLWSNDFSDASEWEYNGFQIGTSNTDNTFGVRALDDSLTSAANGFASYFSSNLTEEPTEEFFLKNKTSIDLSEVTGAYVTFDSYYVKWYEDILLAVHSSAGYSDTISYFHEVPRGYGSSNPTNKRFNISKACGDSAVTVEFIFRPSGRGYGWQIDDVAIIEANDNDVEIERYFVDMNGIGIYGGIPRMLTDSVTVTGYVRNNGKNTADKVKMIVALGDEDKEVSRAKTASDTNSLAPGELATISASGDVYGDGFGYYSWLVASEKEGADQDQLNNVFGDVFTTAFTDTTYARASYFYNPVGTSESWGGAGAFKGATYFVYDSTQISSVSVLLDSNTTKNARFVGKVYFVDDTLGRTELYKTDTFQVDSFTENFNGMQFEQVTVGFDVDSNGGWLAPNKRLHELPDTAYPDHYLVGVEMVTAADSSSMSIVSDFYFLHNHTWSSWIYYPAAEKWYYESSTPHIYLNIAAPIYVEEPTDTTSIEEFMFEDAQVYPNPASHQLNIAGLYGADVQIFNILGELVYINAEMSDFEVLDVSTLPRGSYIIKIVSGDMVATKKIVLGN